MEEGRAWSLGLPLRRSRVLRRRFPLLRLVHEEEVVVSPPFVFLSLVKGLLGADFSVAAQNCWVRKGGAFTGEISAEMLVNLGIPWVILGHSERRLILNEANERKESVNLGPCCNCL